MDIKYLTLVVIVLVVTAELTETYRFPGGFLQAPFLTERRMTRQVLFHSETQQREKRSVEDADMNLDEYMALRLADKPHSRQKRALISGNIIVVGVISGVAGVLCLIAMVWALFVFARRKET